jgi:Tfp pilus assembly protein PilF
MPKSSKKMRTVRAQQKGPDRRQPSIDHRARWEWASAVVLAVIVLGVYWRAVTAPFIFDDINSVKTNESIRSLWPLVGDAETPGPLYGPQFAPTSARPVANLSLAVSYYFGGLNPAGYRLFNMVLHVASAMLLAAIVRRTLRLPYFADRFADAADWLALAVAVVWVLHPLQTEAVAYITQRTELMLGFFYLATLYCSLRYWTAARYSAGVGQTNDGIEQRELLPSAINTDRTGWLVLATLACLAGMGSKQAMASAPLIVLLFERTFVAGSLPKALSESWPLYVGLACGWLLLLGLNYNHPHRDSAGFHLGVSAFEWWFTQAKVLLMYFKLVAWPWPLVIHYEMPYLQSLGEAWPYLASVGLLGLAILVLLWRNHPVGFLGTFVFAILLPTLLVPLPTEIAAERRMYLPLAAIGALVVVGGYALAQSLASQQWRDRHAASRWATPLIATVASTSVVALVLAGVSNRRLASYDDPMTLWQEVLRVQPHNHVAHSNVGREYYDAGNIAAAGDHFRQAIQQKPDSALAHYNMALVLSKTGQRDEAINHFRLAVQYRPGSPELLNNLGVSLYMAGRNDEAISVLREAIQLKPTMWRGHDNLGTAQARAGRADEAIASFQQALKVNPQALDVYGHLADAQAKANRPAEAIATVERAVRLALATGDDATAAKIEAQLASYRASLADADPTDIVPNFGSAMPSQ